MNRIKPSIGIAFIQILAFFIALFTLSCGAQQESGNGGFGSIVVRIIWPGDSAGAGAPSTQRTAPAGVVTMRMIITASDMSHMQADFQASLGQGAITQVPAGDSRTLVVYGLDSGGIVVFQGTSSVFYVADGQTTTVLPVTMASAHGALDMLFGTSGIVTTDFGANNYNDSYDRANDVAIQSDGKIVVIGVSDYSGFALARYNTDGNLDASFGVSGKVTTPFGSEARAVAIQNDGKILAAGGSYNNNWDFAIIRYNTDGSLDSSFGTSGYVTTDINGRSDAANAVVIQNDGKIVVAGSCDSVSSGYGFALVRYNVDGSQDSTFGASGKVTTYFPGNNAYVKAIALQNDGKIVAAGYSYGGGFLLVRYNGDGSLDPSFGVSGKVTTNIGNSSECWSHALAIQEDGKIVAAGETYNGSNYVVAIVRYTTDGSLDLTFGDSGKVTSVSGDANDVVIQKDGKIVSAGSAGDGFTLVRYNTDGSLDATFGSSGTVSTAMGSGSAAAHAVTLQGDGKVVAAGTSYNILTDFALVRYLP